MKKHIILLLLISISFLCFSQDLIIKKDGDIIECKVLYKDSISVHFSYKRHDNTEIKTFISLDQIKEIDYEADLTDRTLTPDSIFYQKTSTYYKYYHRNRPLILTI